MFKTATALPALFSTLPALFSRVFVPDLQLAVKAGAAAGLQMVVHKVLNYADSAKASPHTKDETKTFIGDRVRWIPKPNTVSLGIIGAVALLRFYNFSSLSSAVASVGMLVGVEELIFSGITWLEAEIIDVPEKNDQVLHKEVRTIIQNRFSTLRASIFAGMAFLALRTAGSITSQSRLITLGNGGMIASLVSSVGICALTFIELKALEKFKAEDPKIRPLILKSVTLGASLGLTALVTGAVGFILKHSGRSFQGSLAYWAALLMTNGVASLYVSTRLRVALEQADKKELPELTQTHLMTIVKALQGLILAGPGVLIANKAIQSLGSVYLLSARSLKIGFSLLALGSIGGASYFAVETLKEGFQNEKSVRKNLSKHKQLAQTNFEWFQKIHGLLLGTAAVWSTGYWLNLPRLNFWSSRTTGVLLIADIWMVYKTYTEIDRDLSSAGGINDRRAQLNLIGWEGDHTERTYGKDWENPAHIRVSTLNNVKNLTNENRLSILDLFDEMNKKKTSPNFQQLPAAVLACFIKLYLYRLNDTLSRPDALLGVKNFCNFYCPEDQKTLEGLMNTLPQDISSYLTHEELAIFLETSLLEKADAFNPQTEAKSQRAALQMERKRFMMSMDERVGTAATFDELKYLSGAIDRCDFSKISGDYSLLYQVYCYYFDWAVFNQNEERDHVAAADVHAKETMRLALSHCEPEMLKNLLYVAAKENALSHLIELFTEKQAYSVAFEEQHSSFFGTGNLGLVMRRVNQLNLQDFDLANIDLLELLGRKQIGNGTKEFTLVLSECENFQSKQIIELMKSRKNSADGDRIKLRIVFEKMTYDVDALMEFYRYFKDGTAVTLEWANCPIDGGITADTWKEQGYTDDHFTAILEKCCPNVPIPGAVHVVYEFDTMLPRIFKMALEEGASIKFPYAAGRPATSWALNCLNDNNEKNALAKVKMFLERGIQQGHPVEHLDFRNWQTPNLLETLRAIYPIKSQQGAMIRSLNLMNVVVRDEDVRNLLLLFPNLQELYLGKANITEAALRNIKIKEWTDGKLVVKNDEQSLIG